MATGESHAEAKCVKGSQTPGRVKLALFDGAGEM